MPRRPRVDLDGVPVHIVQRGRSREPCFFAEDDHLSYLHWLGEARLTPHSLYLALGRTDNARQAAYRELFRSHLDQAAIDDIRLALNQNQPLGDKRFLAKIEKVTGVRREPRPRGRPRLEEADMSKPLSGQGKLSLE